MNEKLHQPAAGKKELVEKYKQGLEMLKKFSEDGKVTAEIDSFLRNIKKHGISLEEIGASTKDLVDIKVNGMIATTKKLFEVIMPEGEINNVEEIKEDDISWFSSYLEQIDDFLQIGLRNILIEKIGISEDITDRLLKRIKEIDEADETNK